MLFQAQWQLATTLPNRRNVTMNCKDPSYRVAVSYLLGLTEGGLTYNSTIYYNRTQRLVVVYDRNLERNTVDLNSIQGFRLPPNRSLVETKAPEQIK